jgi:energy-converting hydrogenase B subunit I
MSTILKIFAFPVSLIIICYGILTILGGHITPGGGFQGGSYIAGGIILCIIVYGLEQSPIQLSHDFISIVETIGALLYIILGLAGLFTTGFFLYNVGTDFYHLIPNAIATIFRYQDVTNAGSLPYLNIVVGLKVFVGLAAIVIAFVQFERIEKSEGND